MQPAQTIYLTTAYLAPVQYYTKLLACGKAMIEQYDHYMKQSYRNRCCICGPGGVLPLSIPIVRPATVKCYTKDIRISDHGNWRHLHWNALESAYNMTPYFEYYKDDFRPFYEKKYAFLTDFNEELCRLICRLLNISPKIERTATYKEGFSEGELDFRERIHPKKDFRTEDPGFMPKPYYQVFEDKLGFQPNLSIVDLLFNMGPEGELVLGQSLG